MPEINLNIQPSLKQLKNLTKNTIKQAGALAIQAQVDQQSRSALWYKAVTDLAPNLITRDTPRKLATIIARLRLGYKCCWEIINPVDRECNHCNNNTNDPLNHYLLDCSVTADFRSNLKIEQAMTRTDRAIQVTRNILTRIDRFSDLLTTFPPPR